MLRLMAQDKTLGEGKGFIWHTERETRDRESKGCPLGTKEDEQDGERRASSQRASIILRGGRKEV